MDVHSFESALNIPLAQDFLLPEMFRDWITAVGIYALEFDACAGASVPGFYGGKREIANLTLDNVEVYLSFTRQLWEAGQKAGPGSLPPHLVMTKER